MGQPKDQKIKRSKDQKIKRSKDQKIKRSKDQKIKRSKDNWTPICCNSATKSNLGVAVVTHNCNVKL
ncbi:hypothetical protein CTM75_13360 [Photobacterium phosphoreum]|nr:hypothetical protein CTM75_13360 [Photobacterium phosphoreum]